MSAWQIGVFPCVDKHYFIKTFNNFLRGDNRMKKKISLILFIFVFVFSTACNGSTENKSTKKIITFGYTGYCSYDTEIDHFNSTQDVYEIQMKHYIPSGDAYVEDINGAGSSEECKAQLIEDIKNGNGPDIIDLASFSLCVSDPNINIYLEDLYPYIDSDSTLNRSDFISSFMNAYEVNGALYSTANALLIHTSAVSAPVAQNGTWNIEMLPDTVSSIGGVDNLSYVVMDSEVLFCNLIESFRYDFVDTEKEYVNFECDAYRNLLKLCGELGNEDYTGAATNDSGVLYMDQIRSFYYPQLYKSCFRNDFTFASNLDGSTASYWNEPFEKLAMNNASEHKDAIWQFLRIFMTEEYQKTCSTFPSNLAALEYQIDDAQQGNLEKTIDSISTGERISRDYTPITSFDSSGIVYSPVSADQIQRILDLMDSTTRINSDEENQCIQKAREIAQQYFDEEIDLNTAVNLTQEDVTAIINHNGNALN